MSELLTRTSSVSLRRRAERKYKRLLDEIFKQVEEKIVGLSDVAEINSVLLSIANSPRFHDLCAQASQQIVTMLAVGQKSTWLAAAKSSSQGRTIYRALMHETTNTAVGQTISNIVAQNAQLIKTVPQDMAHQFTKLAQQRRFQGVRPEEITKEILSKTKGMEELKEFGETEARRIARTESAKASTALIEARSEQYGREFYIWDTAGDGNRVRPSHRIMEGVICRWSDPPNPERLAGEKSYGNYHPGGIFNCRCIPLPIIAIEDIKFPAKVHIAGSIVTINSLKDFKARFGLT